MNSNEVVIGAWVDVDIELPKKSDWFLIEIADPDDIGWACDRPLMAFYSKFNDRWDSCDPVEDGQPVIRWMELPKLINKGKVKKQEKRSFAIPIKNYHLGF